MRIDWIGGVLFCDDDVEVAGGSWEVEPNLVAHESNDSLNLVFGNLSFFDGEWVEDLSQRGQSFPLDCLLEAGVGVSSEINMFSKIVTYAMR